MTLSELIEKYRLPNYFTFWAWTNILIILLYATFYMVYTDGQVTVQFLNNKCSFDLDREVSLSPSIGNMSLLFDDSPSKDYSFSSMRRYYNQVLDRNHMIEKINLYLYILVIPLFNILYGLIIIFDGTIMPPKDLYTYFISIFRGVK